MINEVIEKYRPVNILQAPQNIKKPFKVSLACYKNLILALKKIYTEDQNYSEALSESFDLKHNIFLDYCNTISICWYKVLRMELSHVIL